MLERQKTPGALKWTYQDYLIFSGDKRYEIIEGERYVVPSPNTIHQMISRRLEEILSRYVYGNNLGEIFYAPYDVVLHKEGVVQPDIIFVSKERRKIITKQNIKGSPDLLIEILSPGTKKKDRIEKKKMYAGSGVKEYWIVDPDSQTIEVMVLEESGYTIIGKYNKKQNLVSPMFKELSINLKEVF